MSINRTSRTKQIILAALGASTLWLGACTKDEAPPSEPVEAQTTAEDEVVVEETTPEEAPPPPAEEPAPEPQATAQEAAAPAPAPAEGPKPVVRYVAAKSAKIYPAPAEDKDPVGTLAKGERVMVTEDNGWGRINESMYVKLDQLSAKAVPRKKTPAVWSKPQKK